MLHNRDKKKEFPHINLAQNHKDSSESLQALDGDKIGAELVFEDIKPTAPAHHNIWVDASNETFVNYEQRNLNRLVKNNKANGK